MMKNVACNVLCNVVRRGIKMWWCSVMWYMVWSDMCDVECGCGVE